MKLFKRLKCIRDGHTLKLFHGSQVKRLHKSSEHCTNCGAWIKWEIEYEVEEPYITFLLNKLNKAYMSTYIRAINKHTEGEINREEFNKIRETLLSIQDVVPNIEVMNLMREKLKK